MPVWLRGSGAACALLLVLAFGHAARATLLADPLLFPKISFDNGGVTTYDADTNLFLVDANPVAMRLTPNSTPPPINPVNGDEMVRISILVDHNGALIGGTPGDDLLVTGSVNLGALESFAGVLLTGEIDAFGFADKGTTTDLYDFRFHATGGLLAFLWGSKPPIAGIQSESSTFTGDFHVDFGGEAKGTVGATVPEPSTGMLVAIALAGFALRARSATAPR